VIKPLVCGSSQNLTDTISRPVCEEVGSSIILPSTLSLSPNTGQEIVLSRAACLTILTEELYSCISRNNELPAWERRNVNVLEGRLVKDFGSILTGS